MIPCQFCKILKSTFFIEHLRWLLLAILKPLDSQRQLCKWISKLATIYFISTFCWHFCVYFWQAQVFLLHLDGPVVEEIWRFWFFTSPHNWSVTQFFGLCPLILIQHPSKFWGTLGLVNVEIKRFDFTRDHVINVSPDFVVDVLSS